MSSLSSPAFQIPQPLRTVPPNRVIVSLDLDQSLIGPATRKSIATLNRLHDQKQIYTLINTGNDLKQLNYYDYGNWLTGLKVDAVALNDGQELYLNQQPEEKTADLWFKTLEDSDKDKDWQEHLNTLGWNVPATTKTINSTIHSVCKDSDWKDFRFYLRKDKAKFNIQGPVDEASQEKINKLLEGITEQLANQGIKAVGRYSISGNEYKVVFSPEGIHKAAPIEFLLGLLSHITGVVSLGDNNNDREMMVAKTFQNNESIATNFPTMVGNFRPLKKALEKHPTVRFTTEENVPRALEQQIDAALTKPRFSAIA
jgi:hydroxymethylpyrimidine pyrophosphatase-like HAD family hydrolase